MGFTEKNLHKSQYPLIGFGGKRIEALSKIELNVTFGEGGTQRTEPITFNVVDIACPYNAIFGRNSIIKFTAVINQTHKEGVMPAEHTKKVLLCEDVSDLTVTIGRGL